MERYRLSEIRGAELNPRKITAKGLQGLVDSLLEFPGMMSMRPFVINADKEIIGGNQRFKALCLITALSHKQIVARLAKREKIRQASAEKRASIHDFWKKWLADPFLLAETAADWDDDDCEEFKIKDNVSAGEFDLDVMAAAYDIDLVSDWVDMPASVIDDVVSGVSGDLPSEGDEPDDDGQDAADDEDDDIPGLDDDALDFAAMMSGDRLYSSDNDFDIPSLLLDKQPVSGLELPFAAWGSQSRKLRANVATYHFYVDDYRFGKLWKNPIDLIASGCRAIVEPNCSCHDQTPLSVGLSYIYRKRYLARYAQECGIAVYADLNVAPKFMPYNRMGIPKGYNAFATRGAGEWLSQMELVLETAREISGLERPNLLVYGGGAEVKRWAQERGVTYVEQFINNVDHALKKEQTKKDR